MTNALPATDNQCYGCGACSAICPKSAIEMRYDSEGFLRPVVDNGSCIGCSLCEKVCPSLNPPAKNEPLAYYVLQIRDHGVLHMSSSGGAAYGFGKSIIDQGGVVVGCVLGNDLLPVHVATNSKKGLAMMQGSKYVQSALGQDLFTKVARMLNDGTPVLFTGTPCQVASLYSYLGTRPNNLLTIDLICHGVASPGVYSYYLAKKERELDATISNVRFRCKDVAPYPGNRSLHLDVENDSPSESHLEKRKATATPYCVHALDDPYCSAFYHNRILRESCYRCAFACRDRVADVTLGDYGDGGVKAFPTDDGFSFVGVNTKAGADFLRLNTELFYIEQIDACYSQVNLRQPTLRPKSRDKMQAIMCRPGQTDIKVDNVLRITLADRAKRIVPSSVKDSVKMVLGRFKVFG